MSKFVLLRSNVFESGSIVDLRLCKTGGMHWLGILRLSRYLNGLQKGTTVSVIVRKVNENGINSADLDFFLANSLIQKSHGVFFWLCEIGPESWTNCEKSVVLLRPLRCQCFI